MREGMLWFDNSEKREMQAKIERGADYYQSKYGTRPTLVFVNPVAMLGQKVDIPDIEVRVTHSMLEHHFWFGLLNEPVSGD